MEHDMGLLGRLVVVAIQVGHRMTTRDKRVNVIESSRQLSGTADAKPASRILVLASNRPERQQRRFDRANIVIRSIVVLAVEVLGDIFTHPRESQLTWARPWRRHGSMGDVPGWVVFEQRKAYQTTQNAGAEGLNQFEKSQKQ